MFSDSGVLMWEVYSEGRLPYECRSNAEVVESLNAGLRLLKPRLCPEPVYQLMQWCWKEVSKKNSVFNRNHADVLFRYGAKYEAKISYHNAYTQYKKSYVTQYSGLLSNCQQNITECLQNK